MSLSDDELERYARHIVLKEVGGAGQAKLGAAKALVVGAGGLGAPLLMYLAAAGVGTLGIVDDDTVSLSNLQRQIVHDTASVGVLKTASAARSLQRINPHIRVVQHQERLTAANARRLIAQYDVVADGSDNFATRFLVNDACFFEKKTLVSGALAQFDGQLAVFKPREAAPEGGHYPCYRCLYPAPPPPEAAPNCAEAGILGALAGVIGTLQAVEVLKEILGIGTSLAGRLLIYDGLSARLRIVSLKADPACALCGAQPTILAVT
jgi:molybdopterin-synthase adenylyltransferase